MFCRRYRTTFGIVYTQRSNKTTPASARPPPPTFDPRCRNHLSISQLLQDGNDNPVERKPVGLPPHLRRHLSEYHANLLDSAAPANLPPAHTDSTTRDLLPPASDPQPRPVAADADKDSQINSGDSDSTMDDSMASAGLESAPINTPVVPTNPVDNSPGIATLPNADDELSSFSNGDIRSCDDISEVNTFEGGSLTILNAIDCSGDKKVRDCNDV